MFESVASWFRRPASRLSPLAIRVFNSRKAYLSVLKRKANTHEENRDQMVELLTALDVHQEAVTSCQELLRETPIDPSLSRDGVNLIGLLGEFLDLQEELIRKLRKIANVGIKYWEAAIARPTVLLPSYVAKIAGMWKRLEGHYDEAEELLRRERQLLKQILAHRNAEFRAE